MPIPADSPRYRFMCDVMLARLARYLRAAGYDTLLAAGHERDAELVARAAAEDRWLLTLDRQILEHKAGQGRVLLLAHGTVEEQARFLAGGLGVDWLAQPFSRCLVDNQLLLPAPADRLEQVPSFIRAATTEFMLCAECGRVYWAGSHHRRMQATLEAWVWPPAPNAKGVAA
jgi:uncharacterized protein with PIN domain